MQNCTSLEESPLQSFFVRDFLSLANSIAVLISKLYPFTTS